MTEPTPTPPKLFISYSWSNADHEQWVVDLANRLVESGVDAILDKWDLREGHDTISFMEKMVNAPDIKKVIMICDEVYAQKANGRNGGVGTETQIISKEIYSNNSQDKFVAVLAERDEHGKPFLPTYYNSRLFVDLSNDERFTDEFEKLLRWIFDKPLHKRPELGKRPAFLDASDTLSLGTTSLYHRCIDALRQGKPHASGSLDEYIQTLKENLARFRISGVGKDNFDDDVVASINMLLPYRDEIVSIVRTISQYNPTIELIEKIHKLLESIDDYTESPTNVGMITDWDCDNFKFFITELFLHVLATLVKSEKFQLATIFFDRPYYLQRRNDSPKDGIHTFESFCFHLGSIESRNRKLAQPRISLEGDMIKARCTSPTLEFRDIMQADFLAYLRHTIVGNLAGPLWWPHTLVYAGHATRPFELFSRSVSRAYFNKAKILLGVSHDDALRSVVSNLMESTQHRPRVGFGRLNVAQLTNIDQLCSLP